MKILFSNLPWWSNDRQGIRAGSRWPFTRNPAHAPDQFAFGGYLPAPYFLASAAAFVLRGLPHAQVRLRDSIARGESYRSFLTAFRMDPPDWLIIESATPSWAHDSAFCAQLKSVFPKTNMIVCGTIVAAHDFKLPAWAVAACRGEYEKSTLAVIQGRAVGIIPFNLLTRDEMNSMPHPLFDAMCEQHYWDSCPTGQLAPHLPVMSSRGCPHKCAFCAWPATMTGNDPDGNNARSVRFHTAEWVDGFIRDRLQRGMAIGSPYRSIYFDDDTFNLADRHVQNIAPVMKRIGLPWTAMCRADTIKEETWSLMRESGCVGVKIGIESASQRVLDKIIGKKLNFSDVETKWLPLLKTLGFNVHTTWTIGLPGETPEEAALTEAAVQRLYDQGLHQTHQLSGTAVIEGTPLDAIARGEHLERFPDARVDDQFLISSDGQAKIEEINRRRLSAGSVV